MANIVVAVSNGARRTAISLVLHGAGHAVEAVGDAEALVEAVRKKRPEVLFIDPGLARLTTVEPIRKLQESGDLLRTRVIIVDDPLAPVQGWAGLARQMAGGVLADMSQGSILRVVASAEERAPREAARPSLSSPSKADPDQTGSFRAFRPAPSNSSSPGSFGAPRASADPSKTGAFRAFTDAGQVPSSGSLPAPSQGAPRILVVEDSPTVRAITGIRLEEAGWEVSWAGSAEEGQKMLEATPYAALLADIGLPGMSGDQFALLARKLRPGIRCMLMTGRPRSQWPRMPDDIPIFPKPLEQELLRRELDSIRMLLDG